MRKAHITLHLPIKPNPTRSIDSLLNLLQLTPLTAPPLCFLPHITTRHLPNPYHTLPPPTLSKPPPLFLDPPQLHAIRTPQFFRSVTRHFRHFTGHAGEVPRGMIPAERAHRTKHRQRLENVEDPFVREWV